MSYLEVMAKHKFGRFCSAMSAAEARVVQPGDDWPAAELGIMVDREAVASAFVRQYPQYAAQKSMLS